MGALPRLRLPTRPHRPPHPPPTRPPPIESIRDITGTEKTASKTSSFKIASRISYEMIATYITVLFIQDIWRDYIEPQERHNAFNI